MLKNIISSIKYEIKLTKKLMNSKYGYYSIYTFTIVLKHVADYILSKKLNKPISSFEYLKILKENKIIFENEEHLIESCIRISRRKDKLLKEFSKIDTSKLTEILDRIEKIIDQA